MTKSDFIPPILLHLFRKTNFFVEYSSFDEALKDCGLGYESDDLIKVIIAKTKSFKVNFQENSAKVIDSGLIQTLFSTVAIKEDSENKILDFGGAAGIHYWVIRSAFEADTKIKWCVVETPQMVTAARQFENAELTFRKSIVEAKFELGEIDLIHVNSSLQYLPKPLEGLIDLVNLEAKWMVFFRIPLSEDRIRVVKQISQMGSNGPGPLPSGFLERDIEYPVTFVPIADFEALISSKYKIIYRIKDDKSSFNVGGRPIETFGYICKKS